MRVKISVGTGLNLLLLSMTNITVLLDILTTKTILVPRVFYSNSDDTYVNINYYQLQ